MVDKETAYIGALHSALCEAVKDVHERDRLMNAFSMMQKDSLNLDEFCDNLAEAVALARNEVPSVLPALLMLASEVVKPYL